MLTPDAEVKQRPQIVDRIGRSRNGLLGELGLKIRAEINELACVSIGHVHGIEDAAKSAQARLELVSAGTIEHELGCGLGPPYTNQRPTGVNAPDRVEVVNRLGKRERR